MYRKLPTLILTFCWGIHILNAQTQKIVQEDKFEVYKAKFEHNWRGKEFPLIAEMQEQLRAANQNLEEGSKMILMGFEGCLPCKYQLPKFVSFVAERKNVSFFYLSFDKREVMEQELRALNLNIKDLKNLHLISIDREKIDKAHLSGLGYPVAYFLNDKNIIMDVDANGYVEKEESFFKKQWSAKLLLTQ